MLSAFSRLDRSFLTNPDHQTDSLRDSLQCVRSFNRITSAKPHWFSRRFRLSTRRVECSAYCRRSSSSGHHDLRFPPSGFRTPLYVTVTLPTPGTVTRTPASRACPQTDPKLQSCQCRTHQDCAKCQKLELFKFIIMPVPLLSFRSYKAAEALAGVTNRDFGWGYLGCLREQAVDHD
eukprot:3722186-Rhodomonas_salina.1